VRFFVRGVKRLLRTEWTVISASFIPKVAFRITASETSSLRVLMNWGMGYDQRRVRFVKQNCADLEGIEAAAKIAFSNTD